MRTFIHLTRFYHRFPLNAVSFGSRNVPFWGLIVSGLPDVVSKRSLSISKGHSVAYRTDAHYVCLYSHDVKSLYSHEMRAVQQHARPGLAMYPKGVAGYQPGLPAAGPACVKPRSGGWASRCCFYSTTVVADSQSGERGLDLKALAVRILESSKRKDVMAGSVPLKKVVMLLEHLHNQKFPVEQMADILDRQIQFLLDPDSVTSLTEHLLSHGLDHNSIIQILEAVPILDESTLLKDMRKLFDDSVSHLRSMGFKEADLHKLIATVPQIIFTKHKTRNYVLSQLKGLFTNTDALHVINLAPNILFDPWDETRKKFDYVYFMMGYKQAAIMDSCPFLHGLDRLQDRHIFLVRAGFFRPVKEKDDPKINPNPPLGDVINTSDKVFAQKFGGLTVEEYRTYLKMREFESEEDDDANNLSEDSEEEEEEENVHKKARNRKFKRK